MKKQYSYKLRPGYGSGDLLIEFGDFENADSLVQDVLTLLKANGFQFDDLQDVWMNNEVWLHLTSENGKVTITKDSWGLVFIMGEENQKDILKIDKILFGSGIFEREEVD